MRCLGRFVRAKWRRPSRRFLTWRGAEAEGKVVLSWRPATRCWLDGWPERGPATLLPVSILRQSRRLTVAGPSKGPDRNRSKQKQEQKQRLTVPASFTQPGKMRENILPECQLLLPPRQSGGSPVWIRDRCLSENICPARCERRRFAAHGISRAERIGPAASIV